MAVETRGRSIRITLSHHGETYRFTWPERASEASHRAAKRAENRIKRDLEDGTFLQIEDYLPAGASSAEFGVYAKKWLRSHAASDATKNEYRKALNRYWLPALATTDITRLKPSQLRSIISEQGFPSAKTHNNACIPLRQIFKSAFQDELLRKDLAQFVLSKKHQKKPPDPFSREDTELLIDAFKGTHFEHYFEFMFFSGLRTGEALGLEWHNVDLVRNYVRIDQSQSKGKALDKTKTATIRDVLLNERSLAALQRQKSVSYLSGAKVFVTEKGTGYVTEKAQRAAFTRAQKKLQIRHRPQYNTRHTYATMLLMAGANPLFVAKQMGHSLQMLLNVYTKWVSGEDDRQELSKLSTQIPTQSSTKETLST